MVICFVRLQRHPPLRRSMKNSLFFVSFVLSSYKLTWRVCNFLTPVFFFETFYVSRVMIASCHHSDTHIIYNNAFFYIYLFLLLLLVNPNSPRAQVDLHQFLKIHVRLIFCSDNINNYQSFFKMCIIFPSISIALIGHHRRLFSPPDVIKEPMRPSLNPVPPFPFFLSFLACKSSSYVGGWGGIPLSFFMFSVFW